MPDFRLYRNVHENVRGLRVALGSIKRPLSYDDFAERLRREHPNRSMGKSTIKRWETDGEPDLASVGIMARWAGVTFEAFALGDPHAAAPDWPMEADDERDAPTLPLKKPQKPPTVGPQHRGR